MSRTILFHSMWDIKLKATNNQDNKQTKTHRYRQHYGSYWREWVLGGWLVKGRGSKDIVTEDWTWGGGHTVQCTDDVSLNCTLETYIIILVNDTPISLIK